MYINQILQVHDDNIFTPIYDTFYNYYEYQYLFLYGATHTPSQLHSHTHKLDLFFI